jgi:CRISPR system Cascade subunit CasE
MYFSRVTLRRDHLPFQALLLGDAYTEHQLLWTLFDKSQDDRPFLFRREAGQSLPCFYMVSEQHPADDNPALAVECKEYRPQLRQGEVLQFMLRANPVVSRRDNDGKQKRHDVVMDQKFRSSDADAQSPKQALVREAGLEWLTARAENGGFEIRPEETRVDGYQQHRFAKRRNGNTIQLSTLDFSGVLTVTDPQQLTEILFHGLGPAKAFGCGLLMVRRS